MRYTYTSFLEWIIELRQTIQFIALPPQTIIGKTLFLFCLVNSSVLFAASSTLTQVQDSLGNTQTNSIGTNGQLAWPANVNQPVVIAIGDTLIFTAEGTDEEDENLEFQFSVQRSGGSFEVTQAWSFSRQWVWQISAADFGEDVTVSVSVRDSDGLDEYGSINGDDYTNLVYDVRDPNAVVQPLITDLRDNRGNISQNSFGSNEQDGWTTSTALSSLVNIGDRISLTVQANAFDGQTLEYQFSVQPPGGSFEIIRPWSTSNSAIWVVAASQFGSDAFVSVSVRNQDGRNVFGEFGGDDNVTVQYTVNDPNASRPASLLRVVDSLGNLQPNSFGTNPTAASLNQNLGSVTDGNQIEIVATGQDTDSTNLEYRFAVQRVGGSFEVRQDWSADNTWTWEVNTDDFGRELTVLVAVRDDDGRSFFGQFGGDDYTYLQYRVLVDITSIINLLL